MITMDKASLQETAFLAIGMMDEYSDTYERFCGVMLPLLGITGPDGSLTPAYADSRMWTLGADEVLRPSAIVDMVAAILRTCTVEQAVDALQSMGLTDADIRKVAQVVDGNEHIHHESMTQPFKVIKPKRVDA